MNLLSVENITKTFGARVIFKDLTFGVDQGQKVAIVAKNGSGKTTLLRCLIGADQVDDGRIVFRNGYRVAFMEQSENLDESHSIMEEVFCHDLPELQAVKAYNIAMLSGDEKLIENSFEAITELNAWDTENKVHQILASLKLEDTTQLIANLSGGQKKRVALAKVLIGEPDFLILDEPTNHLDLDMIEWLEEYLSKSKSTILMVTHDRYFLEVVCDTILEMEDQTIYKYKGNFSYYLEKKAERQEQLGATIDKARNTMRKELDWIRRQPKARGTKQKARVDSFQDLKAVASQNINEDELEISIKMERLGSKIVEIHKMNKSFGDKKIINDLSYVFKRQERLGIVGNNGTGKSTFLNMIQGFEELDKGTVSVGDTVVFGYFNQDLIQVDEDKKVIDVIRDIAEFIPLEKGKTMTAAHFLEKFLFPRDMQYNYVYKLSGGEKRRLKLMTVLMKNPNFLILDEPTNDLDIFVMSVLEEYLRNFQGCLIVVSHDRYFMDKMVDHLFVFDGSGEIKDTFGNYTVYRQKIAQQLKEDKKATLVPKLQEEEKVIVPKNPSEKRKMTFKEKVEFKNMEAEIEALENEKALLTDKLSDSSLSNLDLMNAGNRLSEVVKELEIKSDRWLELADLDA